MVEETNVGYSGINISTNVVKVIFITFICMFYIFFFTLVIKLNYKFSRNMMQFLVNKVLYFQVIENYKTIDYYV